MKRRQLKEEAFGHICLLTTSLSTLNVLSTALQQQSNQVLAVLQADLFLPMLVLITTSFQSEVMG